MDGLSSLRGKVAIVWGGGGGRGDAAVKRLAAAGVVDIDGAAAERVAASVVAKGGRALGVVADVRDEHQVQSALGAVTSVLGCPRLSASVVGIALFKPFLETSADDWDFDQQRNLRPAFLIGRIVGAAMRDAGNGGAIVYVASISGI